MSPRARKKRFPLPAALHITASPFARDGRRAVRFTCDHLPPSINQITSMTPFERARCAKLWRSSFAVAAAGYEIRLEPPVSALALFIWGTVRRRDLWNYFPKWPIDGLVDGGLLPDDHAEILTECATRFGFDRDRARLEIVLVEEGQ